MRGREDEFEQVAMPHARSLLRFALRLTNGRSEAEDLVQETLLLAWRGFGQFEKGTNARAWLFCILMNAFRAQHRKVRPSASLVDAPSAHASTVELVETMQVLDRLPLEQRTVLLLAAAEGFTCREIGEILKIPMGTAMSRLSRAREAMREAFAPEKALR